MRRGALRRTAWIVALPVLGSRVKRPGGTGGAGASWPSGSRAVAPGWVVAVGGDVGCAAAVFTMPGSVQTSTPAARARRLIRLLALPLIVRATTGSGCRDVRQRVTTTVT